MRHVHRDAGQALATPKGGTSQKIPQETNPPRISLATTVRRSEPQAPEVPRRACLPALGQVPITMPWWLHDFPWALPLPPQSFSLPGRDNEVYPQACLWSLLQDGPKCGRGYDSTENGPLWWEWQG